MFASLPYEVFFRRLDETNSERRRDVVELMNVREQVDPDYAHAHRRALVGGFLTWVRGWCASLHAFDEAAGISAQRTGATSAAAP